MFSGPTLRIATPTPYQTMLSHFDKLMENYEILATSNAFSHLLAILIEEEIIPGKLYPDSALDPTCALFCVKAGVDTGRLLAKLNLFCPSIEATIVKRTPLRLLADRTISIRLNVAAIQMFLLPRMKILLETHPKLAMELAHASCKTEELYRKISLAHEKVDISISSTPCFTVTMIATINSQTIPECNEAMQTHLPFPSTVLSLIVNFLKLPVASASFENDVVNPFLVNLFLLVEPVETKPLINYFEKIYPGSTNIEEKKVSHPFSQDLLTKVGINTSVLNSNRFVSHYKAALQALPQYKIENFQKASDKIPKTTRECAADLRKIIINMRELILEMPFLSEQNDKANTLLTALEDLLENMQATDKKKFITTMPLAEKKVDLGLFKTKSVWIDLANPHAFVTHDYFINHVRMNDKLFRACLPASYDTLTEKYLNLSALLEPLLQDIEKISKLNATICDHVDKKKKLM